MTSIQSESGSAAPGNVPSLQGAKAEEEGVSRPRSIVVEVIRLRQKEVPMYMGKMAAKDLLSLSDIDAFKEENLDGYQRELYRTRASEIFEYLVKCPIAVMPGVFVSLRKDGHSFKPGSDGGDLGTLDIPYRKGAVWIIDGQHRLGGFEKAAKGEGEVVDIEAADPEIVKELLSYELPVVFVDTSEATEMVRKYLDNPSVDITSKDIESVIFTVVNKTAKSINASLKDALLYKIHEAGIPGIPFIRKEEWRSNATRMAIALYKDMKSPLYQKINIAGTKGLKRPMRLNSFVSSLVRLVRDNKKFSGLQHDEKLAFVRAYWNALSDVCQEGFQYEAEYMLLKTIGVYSVNWLANDVFNWCAQGNIRPSRDAIRALIEPLKTFKWSKADSPLAAFGGLKGVAAAHKLLLQHLADHGILQAAETLEEMEEKKAPQLTLVS